MEDVERFKVKETDMASPIFSLPFSNEIFCRDFPSAWQPKKFKTGRIYKPLLFLILAFALTLLLFFQSDSVCDVKDRVHVS